MSDIHTDCLEHSGLCARVDAMEKDVKTLEGKMDKVMWILAMIAVEIPVFGGVLIP